MVDHSKLKLGKRPARLNLKRRAAAQLLFAHLPPPPSASDYYNGHKDDWGEMLNDNLGDCTIAAIGHMIQLVTMQTEAVRQTPADNVILAMYEKCGGYTPGIPATDQGAYEDDVLRNWALSGFADHDLLSWVDIDHKNLTAVKQAIAQFGAVYMGADLPMIAAEQDVWDVVSGSDRGEWGGHAMLAGKYDANYVYLITWGGVKLATWNWWLKYVDECHVLLIDSWLKRFPSVGATVLVNMMRSLTQ